ncbi:MAG: histone deacetylase family protein, partial [bacterium]
QLALMQVSITGFAQMVRILKELASELCQGRLVFTLEGGYHIQALAFSVKATLGVLLGETEVDDPIGNPADSRGAAGAEEVIQQVKKIHNLG